MSSLFYFWKRANSEKYLFYNDRVLILKTTQQLAVNNTVNYKQRKL